MKGKKGLKSVDFIFCRNYKSAPMIMLKGEHLFDTGFIPDELLMAEVYEGLIIIKRLPMKKGHFDDH